MTNPKIEKIDAAIEKSRAKLTKEQARLRELERQRVILEDAEIVARFRREKLTEDDLNTIIKQKSGGTNDKEEIAPGKYSEISTEMSDVNEE